MTEGDKERAERRQAEAERRKKSRAEENAPRLRGTPALDPK